MLVDDKQAREKIARICDDAAKSMRCGDDRNCGACICGQGEKALAAAIRQTDLSDCKLAVRASEPGEPMTDEEFFASRPTPVRDDLEKNIILPQEEIEAMEWTWGMGDLDRALQNLELERRALSAQVAELQKYEYQWKYWMSIQHGNIHDAIAKAERCEAAEAQVAELKKDAERLNDLQRIKGTIYHTINDWRGVRGEGWTFWEMYGPEGPQLWPDIRSAMDAAILDAAKESGVKPMTASDTPRVDDVELHYRQMEDRDAPSYVVPAEFARQLERENAALKVELDIWKHRAHRAGFEEDLISTSI